MIRAYSIITTTPLMIKRMTEEKPDDVRHERETQHAEEPCEEEQTDNGHHGATEPEHDEFEGDWW